MSHERRDLSPVSFLSRVGYALSTDLTLGLPVVHEIRGANTILDVGCGPPGWSWTRFLGDAKLAAGLGLDRSRFVFSKKATGTSWGGYVLGSGGFLPFRDREMDAVIALDVIEHLPKAEGSRALAEFKRVARHVVVVVTPNGFLYQPPGENPWQAHLSGWTKEDLETEGFTVSGIRGLRFLRGSYARPTLRPLPLGLIVSIFSAPIARAAPSRAFQLMGTWRRGSSV
jgi:SAM-dependent methyltransferase